MRLKIRSMLWTLPSMTKFFERWTCRLTRTAFVRVRKTKSCSSVCHNFSSCCVANILVVAGWQKRTLESLTFIIIFHLLEGLLPMCTEEAFATQFCKNDEIVIFQKMLLSKMFTSTLCVPMCCSRVDHIAIVRCNTIYLFLRTGKSWKQFFLPSGTKIRECQEI